MKFQQDPRHLYLLGERTRLACGDGRLVRRTNVRHRTLDRRAVALAALDRKGAGKHTRGRMCSPGNNCPPPMIEEAAEL